MPLKELHKRIQIFKMLVRELNVYFLFNVIILLLSLYIEYNAIINIRRLSKSKYQKFLIKIKLNYKTHIMKRASRFLKDYNELLHFSFCFSLIIL